MSFAAVLNLKMSQGSTWTIPVQLKDSLNVGVPIASLAGKIRADLDDAAARATFSCSVSDPTNGIGQAVLSAATTAALVMDASPTGERALTKVFYDIEATLADTVTVLRILEGYILISPEVTR